MREFDFDELDKAVSSLMNKNQKNSDDKPSDDTSTDQPVSIDAPATATPSEAEGFQAPDSDAVKQPETAVSVDPEESIDSPAENINSLDSEDSPTPQTTDDSSDNPPSGGARSVPHRAGSFMDVKHDSSKMRTSSPTAGRHGITVQPMGSSEPDKARQPELDNSQDEIAPIDETEAVEMSASPFLSDAKVKKRPLGRPGSAFKASKPNDDQPQPEATDSDMAEAAEETAPDSSDDQIGLPEELQPDLVSIESDIDTTATNNDDDAEAETDQKPKVDIAQELEPEPKANEDTKPTGPVSIPQQYKESPSSQPQNNGTIYDTENYHQPIAHPAKKRSGWMIVIWIVLIIILGCALGVAAYFSGLI